MDGTPLKIYTGFFVGGDVAAAIVSSYVMHRHAQSWGGEMLVMRHPSTSVNTKPTCKLFIMAGEEHFTV